MCEGLTKRFHAVAFKKEGKKLAVLKAGGCLGKSAIAIAPPMNKSRRGDDDALEWPTEMPEARALLSHARPGAGAPFLATMMCTLQGETALARLLGCVPLITRPACLQRLWWRGHNMCRHACMHASNQINEHLSVGADVGGRV